MIANLPARRSWRTQAVEIEMDSAASELFGNVKGTAARGHGLVVHCTTWM